jgi:hypothetical protein
VKKALVFFIAMLFALGSCHALSNVSIFKGKVTSGEPFLVENKSFMAVFVPVVNNTIIHYPENLTDVIYGNETCIDSWIYRACMYGAKFYKGSILVPSDVHEGNLNITMDFQLFKYSIGIALSTGVPYDKIYLGETFDLAINLTNVGELNATSVAFHEDIPQQFELLSVDGCRKEEASVAYLENMESYDRAQCTARMKAVAPGEAKLTGNVSYYVLGKNHTAAQTRKVTVYGTPLGIGLRRLNATLGPGENATMNMSINSTLDADVSVRIGVPAQLALWNGTGFSAALPHGLRWDGPMNKTSRVNLTFSFMSRLEGEYIVNITVIYTFRGTRRSDEIAVPVEVVGGSFYTKYVKYDNRTVLRVTNPTKYNFFNIVIQINGTDFSKVIETDSLESRTTKEYVLPILSGEPPVYVRYRTEYGQYMSFSSEDLKAQQNASAATVNQSAKPSSNATAKGGAQQAGQEGRMSGIDLPDIDPKLLFILGPLIAVMVIVIFFVISHKGKSDLDREIEELKKKGKE